MSEYRPRPGWVILSFVVVAALVQAGTTLAFAVVGLGGARHLDSPRVLFATLPTLLSGITATAVAWYYFREPTGLAHPRPARQFSLGFLVGGGALSVACLGPLLVGATTLRLNEQPFVLAGLTQLLALGPAGFGEELLLRGLGFQALRRGLGDVKAVTISSALFGGLHLLNPHASLVAALLITLVGLWFGAVMVRTGAVWMPMGLHVAWNFFEGFVFGQPVSGHAPGTSLLVATALAPPGFWSGGDFGPEAAGWTGVVLALALGLSLFAVQPRLLDLRSTVTRGPPR